MRECLDVREGMWVSTCESVGECVRECMGV
jgi:hypothetical protein